MTRDQIIFAIMKDGKFHTLYELEYLTGFGTASLSAGIRDFRKKKYGSNTVLVEVDKKSKCHQYKLIIRGNKLKEKMTKSII